jgi:ribosomal protein S18 acetylase RimI-like enzyme
MTHPLDRPAWAALAARHSAFAEGGPLARRYLPSIVPFAAAPDNGAESTRALGQLVRTGENILLLQADAIALADDLQTVTTATGVQMISERRLEYMPDERVQLLTPDDAAEMLELAALTRPGPFTLEAMKLGEFWGVRIDGRLAAMAGERMKQPGHTEVSGVCTHPDFRGKGLARLLSIHVADRIYARGETPYLHAYATNEAAIRLYETIGFALRCNVNVALATRAS